MKTIRQIKIGNTLRYVAIVKAKDWFENFTHINSFINNIFKNYYVVVTWMDFHDGEKSNIEGKETIALCAKYEDAEKMYDSKILSFHLEKITE